MTVENWLKVAQIHSLELYHRATLLIADIKHCNCDLKPERLISYNKRYYENNKQHRAKVPYSEELKLYHKAYHAAWFQRRKRKNYF
jgi:hypothetical protein